MDAFAAGDDRVVVLRRRAVLSAACSYASGAAGLLLAACGGRAVAPSATVAPPGVAGSSVAVASPVRPGPASPTLGTPTGVVMPAAVTPATPRATVAAVTPTAMTKLIEACPIITYRGTPHPEDPFGAQFESLVRPLYGFAEEIRRAHLILVGTLREILPAQWNTIDGARPMDLHLKRQEYFQIPPIMTPLRLEPERVLVGSYAFATLYIGKARGQIGADCFVHYTAFDSAYGLTPGQRSIFFLYPAAPERFRQLPVPDDPRYQYYEVSRIFPVAAEGTVEFPALSETREFSYTYRTIPLSQAMQEIVTLTSPATPTR